MKYFKSIYPFKRRLYLLLIISFILLSPVSATPSAAPYKLGCFSKGTVTLVYNDASINTYNAYGVNYISVSDLKLLGFNVSYTSSPKVINITANFPQTQISTSACLKVNSPAFSLYEGTVYLGNFKTQCLLSENRIFIPVGALSNLGTLTISNGICTFIPTGEPPVKATRSEITNLSDTDIKVDITDIYWTDKLNLSPFTYTLSPHQSVKRNTKVKDNADYISTIVNSVSGNGVAYLNNSLRGQVNTRLFQTYQLAKKHELMSDYSDAATLDEVINAENFINSKNLSSPTKYLVWTNISKQRTYIFTGSKNNWSLVKCFVCSTGRDYTPTPKGMFALTRKVPSFGQSKGYCCKYAFGFIGTNYLYHSIIYDKTGTYLLENKGVLGKKASQGCIRFSVENAKWFYDNLISKTTVYIN